MRAIFISHRRGDAESHAQRLFDDLVQRFGEQAVLMGASEVEPRDDVRFAVDEHVGSCSVLLAVIGTGWLDARDAGGQRRLDDPVDLVRLEVGAALRRDMPLVPVLVHGARMPHPEDLPAALGELAFRNAIELNQAHWDSDVAVLARVLSRYVPLTDLGFEQEAPAGDGRGRWLIPCVAALGAALLGVGGIAYGINQRAPASLTTIAAATPAHGSATLEHGSAASELDPAPALGDAGDAGS